MDSELIYSMENLQFTEVETASVVFEPPCDDGDSALWLVGSVVSNKPVNGESVSRIFRSVWKSKHVSEILELRPNFFLIKPTGKDSKDMILKRRPWVVHEDLFSIEPYIPTWRAADFDFNNMTIRVRVSQLPLQAMNGTMGLQLGGCIGRAIGVDHRVEGGNLGEFLRIRVSIDITKPLRRCVLLGNGQGRKPTPCPLKYERLPRFCYFCGLIGHDLVVCQAKPTDLDHRKLQYGSWFRVSVQQPVAGARRRQGIEYFDSKTVSPGIATEATGRNPPSPAESGSTCDLPNPHGDGPPRAGTPQPSNVSVPTAADGPIPPAAPAQTIVKGNAVSVPADISSTTNDSPSKASDAPLATEGITRPEHSVCSSPTLPILVAEVPPSPWPVIVVPDQVNGKQAIVFTAGGRDVVLPSSQAAKEPGLSLPISAVEVKHSEGNKGAESGRFLSISAAVSNPVRAKRSLQGKYEAIGDSLRSWQTDRRVSSTKRMSDLQGFLNSCMQGTITDEAKTDFLEAKREHKSLLDKDEAYWAQRARVTWLTQGDRNTVYFHARASGRRKKNRIRGLFDESGIWTDKQAEVAGVAMRYFSTLFSSSQPTPNSTLLSNIDHCISSDANSSLLRPFTDVEILAAF
ncbi:hypothetical protein V6N13_057388 [Hibiscus sabdariffa]